MGGATAAKCTACHHMGKVYRKYMAQHDKGHCQIPGNTGAEQSDINLVISSAK